MADEPVGSTELGIGPAGGSGAGAAPRAKLTLPATSYELGAAIGRGGMGEVIAAIDRRMGREVAIKRMRSRHRSDETIARFLREARIQAWLDHPAIVPVYELGTDDEGRPFFTMKRISGRTLDQRISADAPQAHLLRAFADVCLAIERAHARGVIHRDLKPSNIMLGDYGEVYVLDWGIARVLPEAAMPVPESAPEPEPDLAPDPDPAPEPARAEAPGRGTPRPDPSDASTKTGMVLGTPGYISPEQLEGALAGPPADVYALGAILFELLAGEPLHPRNPQGAMTSTLTAPQEAPSHRRPERAIPPELDRLCLDALAPDPAARPTAHQLAAQVQAYLDGDRDLERRRELAAAQLVAAHAALASQDPERRSTALRRAGRALALDPESSAAAELASSLLLEPPDVEQSPALAASLEQHEREISRVRSRGSIFAYLSVFVLLPAVFFVEVKSWALIVGGYATFGLGALTSWIHMRIGRPSVPVALGLTLACAILFTRIASPLVLAPLLICGALAGLTSVPAIAARPWLVMAWTSAAVLAPFLLEWAGVFNQSWEIGLHEIRLHGDLFRAHGTEQVPLIVAQLVLTLIVAWLALSLSRQRLAAQRQLYVQAWHLGQLVPRPGTGRAATGHGRERGGRP